MSTGGLGSYAEHHFRKVIPGNIETVRRRLCDTLEDFHYIVLNESPIQAKRSPQRNLIVANILEYDTRLTIALKPISAASTLATFDYAVQYIFSQGDKAALEREADAIIALALAPLKRSVCPACETENVGAVRFCRVCGTPIARSKLPAELEVMRLMAATSAAYLETGWGTITALITLAITLPMIFFGNPKAVTAGWIIFGIGQLLTFFFLTFGVWRLKRTISANQSAQREAQLDAPREIIAAERAALPPPPASITEGTTELMDSSPEAVPLPGKQSRDTDAME
jgi:hypothetical protein